MRTPVLGVLAGGLTFALAACGQTYIDTSVTTISEGATTTTLAPVDASAPLTDLLAEIETRLLDLDQRIIDDDAPAATLARIEEVWDVAEPQIREIALGSVRQFELALDLARTGVTRKRPADASKGYKLMQQVVAAFERDHPPAG